MTPFYSILSEQSEGASWKFIVKMDPQHEVYAGHFPERAIVPGAVLVQLIKELTESALKRKLKLKEAGSIKFLKMIFPKDAGEMEVALVVGNETDVRINAEVKIGSTLHFKMSAIYT